MCVSEASETTIGKDRKNLVVLCPDADVVVGWWWFKQQEEVYSWCDLAESGTTGRPLNKKWRVRIARTELNEDTTTPNGIRRDEEEEEEEEEEE
ncbi:hypothetical protein M0804_007504 [Polistes exclamans]|nr:hypothetical protein M0804_007504 [Polistes exclamans]